MLTLMSPVQDTRWTGLTALDLHKAMCSAKGSAGPDGWARRDPKPETCPFKFPSSFLNSRKDGNGRFYSPFN